MATAPTNAFNFARRGHGVIPLWWPIRTEHGWRCACKKGRDCAAPAKHPHGRLAPRGLLSATTDEADIELIFATCPSVNLGVRTDNLLVLDIDERHGGRASLAALQAAHGALPATWRTRTGGGGEHIIFQGSGEIASTQAHTNPLLGPGIDIRARAGYIVIPPSRHVNGRVYTWDAEHHPADIALAEAPAWLIEKLKPTQPPSPTRSIASADWGKLAAPITAYADAEAARLAGHLLRRYVAPDLAAGLLRAWNAAYCRPPLEGAELARIFERINQLELQRRARDEAAK